MTMMTTTHGWTGAEKRRIKRLSRHACLRVNKSVGGTLSKGYYYIVHARYDISGAVRVLNVWPSRDKRDPRHRL